jgi:hypothetical protein
MRGFVRGLLVLVVLLGVGAALSGRFDVAVLSDSRLPVLDAADEDVYAAIQQVIQHSNDEQVQAISAHDPSLMADTLTSDHYQELVKVNQDLLDNGVASISLAKLEWGAIAVDGSSATATTYETWTTTLSDGTSEQSRDRNDYSLVMDGGAWKINADAHPDDAQVPGEPIPDPNAVVPPVLPFPGIPNTQNTSHNWSGYTSTGGTFSAVSGTWTVPEFKSDGSFGVDAAWVGIGGVRGRDLIQAGTQQTVSGSGSTQYQAWVEMLPSASRPVPLRVHAGDSVSVSIAEESPDQWSIAFTNSTTGQTYSTTEQYRSSHSSAEWIEEAPSGGRGGVLPLDNFGTIDFSGASAIKDGQTVSLGGLNARAITMVGSGNKALAVPSKLTDDGAGFSVARTDVASTTSAGPGTSQRGPRGRRPTN